MIPSLVQPLFDGPLDVVGDVHGEIEAFQSLLSKLGYSADGLHPEGRRLVLLGDLTDRGPDSPGVVNVVKRLVEADRAQCVLGNHDLNLLLDDKKHENSWFFGEPSSLDKSGKTTPAILADAPTREMIVGFFKTLPLVLERPDIRVVHACWHPSWVAVARQASDAVTLYQKYAHEIDADHQQRNDLDDIDRGLEHQNKNPVKVLTSGLEERTDVPFTSGGKLRHEKRVPWWGNYRDKQCCVFGHYSSYKDQFQFQAKGRAICIDFGVAKRWEERKAPGFDGRFRGKLAALRFPEMLLIFDDGEILPLCTGANGR